LQSDYLVRVSGRFKKLKDGIQAKKFGRCGMLDKENAFFSRNAR
jgi:hypothetical protein